MKGWTGNEKWISGNYDTRSNGDWSLQIYNGNSDSCALYIGRLTGEYRGGGFAFFGKRTGDAEADRIVCAERISSGVVFEKNAGDYCQKLFHATLERTYGGLRTYTMP